MVSELGHRHYANYINFFILFNKTFQVELKLEYSITDGISITLKTWPDSDLSGDTPFDSLYQIKYKK